MAWSMVRIAGRVLVVDDRQRRGGARLRRSVSAATANSDWPQYCTSPSANIGSSPANGLHVVDAGNVLGRRAPRRRLARVRTASNVERLITACACSLMAM